MKKVAVLGSTGSIGKSAVEIIERSQGDFEVVGLAAGKNVTELARQLDLFPRAKFTMKDTQSLSNLWELKRSLRDRAVGFGPEGLKSLILETKPELVINALVGIVGLIPTVAALELGCTVALANKEALVTAGEIIKAICQHNGARIIPIDSEHFSISRCLKGYKNDTVEIVLTASGGPFYERSLSELASVSVREVLNHPTWRMGMKVTVDSAHLLNKGLEVIEAHYLFDFPYNAIKVLIHPQSVVHSIIRLSDGSLLAHLGPTDMRLPIMSALYFPDIMEFPWKTLDLEKLGRLEFFPMDGDRFPAFRLAMESARIGGSAPAVLNAADEVAVEAFLAGKIGFLSIIDWIEEALSTHHTTVLTGVETVLEADRWTRKFLAERHHEATMI